MQYKDYYKILGVDRDIDHAELKKSYRKLARKYHPDVSTEANAEERFKEVNEAYEVLGDETKRAQYDNLGADWQNGQSFNPPPGWDGGFDFNQFTGGGGGHSTGGFSDFFESMFGGGFQQGGHQQGAHQQRYQQRAKPANEVMKLYVDLEDVYAGNNKRVRLPNGSSVEVKIPKGIEEGKKIRLSGKASTGGDLHLHIAFNKHPVFKREDKDIYLDLPIAPWEAALGTSANIKTLSGELKLKIPAGSTSGKKMRIKGRGLPGKSSGNLSGDQFVVIQIVTPPAETDEDKKFYEEMEKKFDWKPR
ncbi:DnaJ domain-containing protein [Cocleimonas sp. KMM 6892]|uniref:DnaJ C-terminal domain-containing protein n=1 Tax=unclassified Cocleimonas TaxID=2639732 RepID=UPI002DB59552|nr:MULTISPECIES: DnaJ C-terminal domain-containing protein [unclassified Cocleimonas]MEB8432391.1 DnaJ domain-containing protein [Cocleimonas sp. KMM 6892]MEC4715250.1 DnaJ domain-containing protein [Cocleimonas sp. KMM 6895]MEC4745131.1 DnaJ domain-containing protein [Cocleimonas sp. KMM 6896]